MTTFGARLGRRGTRPGLPAPAPPAGAEPAGAGPAGGGPVGVVLAARATAPEAGAQGDEPAAATDPTSTAGSAGPPAPVGGSPAGLSPAGPAPDRPAADQGPPWWKQFRLPLIATLAVLLIVLFLALANSRSVRGELDPDAVDQQGSHALAVLLDDRGVTVERLTRATDASTGDGERSVVFIPFPNLVPSDVLRRVGDRSTGQVVLIAPDRGRLAAVTESVTRTGAADVENRAPGCLVDGPAAAGAAETGGNAYQVANGDACYPAGSAATVAFSRTRGGARLVVLGSGAFLTNGRLANGGNAALGLNLLGADGSADQVRWLVPGPGSATTDDQASLSDILPGWVGPAALQLLIAALLAALWRARRLGPPVTEPLPVVVRSAEAVEGRARLYRRAQARDRAAEALRAGARARLVPRLGLGRDAGGEPVPAAVAEVVADWTGQPESDVHATLYGPPPPDDLALVKLADSLDSIVRSTLDPEVRRP